MTAVVEASVDVERLVAFAVSPSAGVEDVGLGVAERVCRRLDTGDSLLAVPLLMAVSVGSGTLERIPVRRSLVALVSSERGKLSPPEPPIEDSAPVAEALCDGSVKLVESTLSEAELM